ncbi:hypothetical protein VPH35_073597 [Triticum aestivum]
MHHNLTCLVFRNNQSCLKISKYEKETRLKAEDPSFNFMLLWRSEFYLCALYHGRVLKISKYAHLLAYKIFVHITSVLWFPEVAFLEHGAVIMFYVAVLFIIFILLWMTVHPVSQKLNLIFSVQLNFIIEHSHCP